MKAAFLIAVLITFSVSATAQENNLRANTITVHGDAVIKIAPDQLTLPVTVHEENANLKTAKDHHDDKLRKLLALAERTGIAKDKIQTSYTAINPVYDYEQNSTRPRLRGYTVETSLEFRLTDFARLGDFMNGVIAAGIDQIGSVSYSLQDEEKVKDDTLNLALAHAYDKASRLAATAKVTLDKPLIIEEGEGYSQPPMQPRPMMMKAMAMSSAEAAPPQLPSGVMEMRQSITVTYSLK